uniref:Protein YIF1 n=1 Tax=Angiostrongylus cantonensis TaxID=6313 RepID=A0A0K0CTZ8_ANGCA
MSNDWSNDWGDASQMGAHLDPYNLLGYLDGLSSLSQGQPFMAQHYQSQTQQYDYYGQENLNAGSISSTGHLRPYHLSSNFLNDPMMRAAQHFGGQFAEQQKEKVAKYLNAFNLKYYFSVDNSYVGKKLGILLFPFFHRDWSLKYSKSEGPVPAKDDINAPDLYIPLMAFITYIIVSGFVLGTQGRFSPEMLGMLTSNAFIWIIIENIVIFVIFSSLYVIFYVIFYATINIFRMIICLLMYMAGGKTFYYCTLFYTTLALVFFLLRTVKNFVLDSHHFGGEDGRKRKLALILFILITQPFIMWWLTSGTTNFEYGKFSFAQTAMRKMGLGDVKPEDVPLTSNGEVDYEALLKMP